MPSAAYFRRQADICLQLSLIASNETVSSRLIAMAKDYQTMSEALATEAPAMAGRPGAPKGDSSPMNGPLDPSRPPADC